MPFGDLKEKISCNFNILNYYTIRSEINSFLLRCKEPYAIQYVSYTRPLVPLHLKPIIQTQGGCRKLYRIFNNTEKNERPLCEHAWDQYVEKDNSKPEKRWTNLYKICHMVIHDHEYLWLQYRILFKILGTSEYLKKLKISQTNDYRLCKQAPETIVHLFTKCNKTSAAVYIPRQHMQENFITCIRIN